LAGAVIAGSVADRTVAEMSVFAAPPPVCHFQPIWCRDGRLLRFEALRRPVPSRSERRRSPEARVQALAELIDQAHTAAWALGVPVAVNVDAWDVEMAATLLAGWRDAVEVLAVEVTEHARPDRSGLRAVGQLVDWGFRVALDDVGEGYWVPSDLDELGGVEVKVAPALWRNPRRLDGWASRLAGRFTVVEQVEVLGTQPSWADAWQGYAGGWPAPLGDWVELGPDGPTLPEGPGR
jgi:hypothetical protein